MANFTQIIQKLNKDYAAAVQQDDGNAYSKLSTIFEGLDTIVRETMQDLGKEEMKKIIQKLEKGKALTQEEKEHVRLWIVGDADYYAKMENNVSDWKAELERLIQELNRLEVSRPDVETLCKMRSLFRDGARVIADLFFYAEQQDRLNKFNEAIQEIDEEEKGLLIGLLQQKIKSPDF
ncbi:MAG: hypothetical protein WC450_00855 [Candidatus Omnitrophota bacterium]|jgi:hypothetical protein